MVTHNETFSKLAKNKSVSVQRICGWIIDNRDMKSYGDINDKSIRNIVGQAEYDLNHIYICTQDKTFR